MKGMGTMKKYKISHTFTYEGQRYRIYGDTEKEVYEKMALKRHDLETGHVIINGDMTFSAWAEKCFQTYKSGTKETTRSDQWYQIRKHVLPYIGFCPVKSIRPIQCQEILNSMSGMSYSSIHKVQTNLKFIFQKALENKMIYENPAANLVRPAAVKGERRSLTPYEEKHFLAVLGDDRFLVFALMYYCGCRPGEAISCIGSDIRIKNGRALLHIRGTKTSNSDRWVPLPRPLYERVEGTGAFLPIAPNKSGHKHTRSSYERAVGSLERAMNISMGVQVYRNALVPPLRLASDFVPYDLRHTYCTNLQKAGVDIRTAQRLMGHASIEMTANIYTHIGEEQILSAADTLGADVSDKVQSIAE